jgi:hypothetical protein
MKAPRFETTRTLATVLAYGWVALAVWSGWNCNFATMAADLGAAAASLTVRGCYTMLIMFRPWIPWYKNNHNLP